MKLFDFLLSVFFNKYSKLHKIFCIAEKLQKELYWTPNISNGMDRIVDFFKATSCAQDKVLDIIGGKKLVFKKEKNQKFYCDFLKFLENTGRCENGWNRTKKGEVPSSYSTYINMLVPYDELFQTRSVGKHLTRRNNKIGEVDYALKESCRNKWNETSFVEKEFVNPFIKNNYDFLCTILKDFKNN